MHLIAPLAAGISGAASGTALIRKRGTGTPATWYNTFEADSASTSSVDLDDNGGAEVYVNEFVDVIVRSEAGVTVRTFTDGSAASNVEVRSSAFTGTDYSTALTGAGKPNDLATILDLWLTSAGTTDFKVLVGGVATLLKNAVAAPQFYNPKDAKYGAVGDGAANDSAAIQAAFDAAHAAGGGWIFFPPGTYIITDSLTWYNDINILGCGPQKSILSMDDAAHDHLSASGNTGNQTLVIGMAFEHAQTSTGVCVNDNSNSRAHVFLACSFGTTTYSTGVLLKMDTAGSYSWIHHCAFAGKNNAIQGNVLYVSDTSITISVAAADTVQGIWCGSSGHISNCRIAFSLSAATATGKGIYFLDGTHGTVTGCYFDMSAASATMTAIETQAGGWFGVSSSVFAAFGTSATGVCVRVGAGAVLQVTGCSFPLLAGASSAVGISLADSTSEVSESGNNWPANVTKGTPRITPYSYSINAANFGHLHLDSRNGFVNTATQSGGGTKTLSSDLYGHIALTVSDNTGFTLQLNLAPVGSFFTVDILANAGAGSGAIAWGSNVYGNPGGGFSIATTKHRIYTFRSAQIGASIYWLICGTTFGDL